MCSKEDRYLNMDHQMKLTFEKMNDLRKNKELCDVILQVGPQEICAHKVVLASFSPYFHAMFTSDLAESRQGRITLKGVNTESVDLLVNFAYTGKIEISESTVQSLLPVAAMFQISSVIEGCCVFLESQLDPSNCLGIRYFGELHGCPRLATIARNFSFKHFADIIKNEEFLNLSGDQLSFYMSRDELFVRSEDEVVVALQTWAQHDVKGRMGLLSHLVHHVRLQFVSPSCKAELTEFCKDLPLEPEAKSVLFQSLQEACVSHKRRPPGPTVIFSAGGYLRHSLDLLECFDPGLNVWRSLAPLPIPRSGIGAAYLDNVLYVIGGRNNTPAGNADSALCDGYDPMIDQWTTLAPLTCARNRVAVGVLDGQIYAVGGGSGPDLQSSVEHYDPSANKWTRGASMNSKRIGASLAALNSKLYAIGGYDGNTRLRSVECYDPKTDVWTELSSMMEQRSGAGAAALGGFVYVVGGYDGIRQLNSIERYDPEKNSWKLVCPMMYRRSALGVAMMDGHLYAIGGYDGDGFLSSVEVYDPDRNSWTLGASLSVGRSGAGVTVGWIPSL